MGEPGRLVICAFDPGCDTGWSWLSVAQDSARTKGTAETLREVRPDVELHTLDPVVADMDLGIEHGQFGRREGMDEDQQVDYMIEMIRKCWVHFGVTGRDQFAVVTERFTLRQMDMDDDLLAPVRLNAMLGREMRRVVRMPLWYQTPSDAKRTCTDARLKNWNVYEASSGKHARDADRHSILFMRRWGSQVGLREAVERGQLIVNAQN